MEGGTLTMAKRKQSRITLFMFVFLLLFCRHLYGQQVFKEPTLLWEKEFDPPIREISDQNSNGEFLAIQLDKKGELAHKLLVIDAKE